MTRSPSARRAQLLSSPDRVFLSSFLSDDRNNELSHRDALAAAQADHDRVRQTAIRVYELHELQEERKRIDEAKRKEEERLEAGARIVAEEKRLRELRAKQVEQLPPEPAPEPPKQTVAREDVKQDPAPKSETIPQAEEKKPEEAPKAPPVSIPPTTTPANGVLKKTTPATPTPASSTPSQAKAEAQPQRLAVDDRYRQIHQELKRLRKTLQAESRVAGSPLKGNMGTFRREIRVSIGQLTVGKGANSKPVSNRRGECRW